MRIRGGQYSAAKSGGVSFAGWARAALALGIALLFLGQGAALLWRHADARHAFFLGQKCELPEAASPINAPEQPAPVHHDCEDCLAQIFSVALETRYDIHIAVALASGRVLVPQNVYARSPVRWRASYPARAPPQLS